MLSILLLCLRKDQHIIKINKEELHVTEDTIDKSLEHGGSISKSEQHYPILKVSSRRLEGSLPFIATAHPDKMVDIPDVKLGKYPCLLEGNKRCVKQRQRVFIANGAFVQPTVVDARVQGSVLLNQKEPRSHQER